MDQVSTFIANAQRKYPNLITHMITFPNSDAALSFIRSLSFATKNLVLPSNIMALTYQPDGAKECLLILAGEFTLGQCTETLKKVSPIRVEVQSSASSNAAKACLMEAMNRVAAQRRTEEQKRKWWQFWK